MMVRVLVLAAGKSRLSDEDYPACLTETEEGITLIEKIITQCKTLDKTLDEVKFVFALRQEDCEQSHIDNVVSLLAPGCDIIRIAQSTAGAACTALLGMSYIDDEEELLIINADEYIDANFGEIRTSFIDNHFAAGTVVFNSVHPRYSYVRLDKNNLVVEASEKKPISKHATVGFYWFAQAGDFFNAAKTMIRKSAHINGFYYICPVFNQLVLAGVPIGTYQIDGKQYHPIKSDRQRDQYEHYSLQTSA